MVFPGGSVIKNLPAIWVTSVRSLGREDPLEKGMATTPVFLPGESHVQRNPGYSLWGHEELDMTEQLTLSLENKQVKRECSGIFNLL